MRLQTKFITLAMVGLAISASATLADTYTFKRNSKVGDTAKYKMTAKFNIMGADASATMENSEKVVKVEADGTFHVETAQTNLVIEFGGQKMEQDGEPPHTSKYSSNGKVLEIGGEDAGPDSYRLELLMAVLAPESAQAVGGKWTIKTPADAKRGTPSMVSEYEVLGTEKIGVYETVKIKINIKEESGEAAATASGTYWVSVKDFTMVKGDLKITKAPVPGMPEPTDMSMEVIRQ